MNRRHRGEVEWAIRTELDPRNARIIAESMVRSQLSRAYRLVVDAITDEPDLKIPEALMERVVSRHLAKKYAGGFLGRTPNPMAIELDPLMETDLELFLSFFLHSIHAEVIVQEGRRTRTTFVAHDCGADMYARLRDEELKQAVAQVEAAGVDFWAGVRTTLRIIVGRETNRRSVATNVR